MPRTTPNPRVERDGAVAPFAHEAFLYGDADEYYARCAEFIADGLDAGEPVLVAVPGEKLPPLRDRFRGVCADELRFEAMDELGHNPAWIIPAWADFARPRLGDGRRARGIGEPIWATRTAAELVECERHESLLNVAFADAAGFTLLCPYDTTALPDAVVVEAHRNHPVLHHHGHPEGSPCYRGGVAAWLTDPLPAPPPGAWFEPFDLTSLPAVRDRAEIVARQAGLAARRREDLLVALSEATTNSIRHGGGRGEVAIWHQDGTVAFEVRDAGVIADPLAGRVRPSPHEPGGRGLWLIQQLSDLVHHRIGPDGQLLRAHVR